MPRRRWRPRTGWTSTCAFNAARNLGGSDYGSAERLFNISSSADGNYADGNYVQLPGTVTVHGS